MNGFDNRFSQSSYGDPGHSSAASFSAPQPPASKGLMDGYGAPFDSHPAEGPRYNPLNPTHPRSSALLNGNDPVAMYLLTETAMGDSQHYEILSLEEVEALKKENKFLSGRMDAARRKLALETKLRDAAMSLSKLYGSSKSPRSSQDMEAPESPKSHRSRRSIFGRNGAPATLDKTDEELAISTRKCEGLEQEIWGLERRVQVINKRLLEHTAGVLQMTHKGLKKTPKNNVPHTPESLSSHNTRGSMDDFDDRSLYKTADNLDDLNRNGARAAGPAAGSQVAAGVDLEAIQNTERKLEYLSGKMREMILQSNPATDLDPMPQQLNNGGPVNPTTTVEAYLVYIENGLGMLVSQPTPTASTTRGFDDETGQRLDEINNHIQYIISQTGMHSHSPSPQPDASGEGVSSQLSYLTTGLESLEKRVESLMEQKDILKTQIQQQRELNSKSDAERDAHIADLVEQLTRTRKDLEHSEQEGQRSQDELTVVIGQLEAARQEHAQYQQQRSIPDDNADVLASEKEARTRAEKEVYRLESSLEELRSERESHTEELAILRSQSENEVTRLQEKIEELHRETDARAEEAAEARDRAEQQVFHLEQTIQQVRTEADARVKEVTDSHAQAESEVARLQASMDQLHAEVESQLKEATDGRTVAEENAARMQHELTEMEGEVVRVQTELTMAKAELDSAYGTRAQRAAQVAANPAIQKEIDELNTRNIELAEELAALKAGKPVSGDLQHRADTLEKELRETIDDYEAMTKSSIEFEKERERFEGIIDQLRDRCEQLETQLHEERINWMGNQAAMGREGAYETTSTMVLKNEFKKMMRDTRIENMKILKAEQEERRRLENLVRGLKKEQANATGKPGSTSSINVPVM